MLALITIIFVAYSQFIGASVTLVLVIIFSFSYQGILIDPENKKYLKYDRFLWFRIGRWMPLSTPSYVTIVRIKLSSRKTAPSPIVLPEDKKGARSYKVNLVVEGDERYVPICWGSLEKMIPEAIRLGKLMNLRVLDYTTHEKKWIL